MNKLRCSLLTSAVIVYLTNVLYAQKHITLAKSDFNITNFKEDSAKSFNNYYVQHHLLLPIQQSAYDLEIRCFYNGPVFGVPDEGECIVIQGNQDSLSANYYRLKRRFMARQEGALYLKDKTQNSTKEQPGDIMLSVKHLNGSAALVTALQLLLLNHIGDLPDEKVLMDSLKQRKIVLKDPQISDCCISVAYEVKIGKAYRNFTTMSYFNDVNATVKELFFASNLDYAVSTLKEYMKGH